MFNIKLNQRIRDLESRLETQQQRNDNTFECLRRITEHLIKAGALKLGDDLNALTSLSAAYGGQHKLNPWWTEPIALGKEFQALCRHLGVKVIHRKAEESVEISKVDEKSRANDNYQTGGGK